MSGVRRFSLWTIRLALAGAALATCRVGFGGFQTNFAASYALYQQITNQVADFDGNQRVDGFDYLAWQRGRGLTAQISRSFGDYDADSNVNATDFGTWKGQFGGAVQLSNGVAFKLFFDPIGILAGRVTAFVEVNDDGSDRFDVLNNSIINRHSEYEAAVVGPATIIRQNDRLRIERPVQFSARDINSIPTNQIQIFGVQIEDLDVGAGLQDVQAGFKFNSGDFITTFDTATLQTQTFLNLPPVPVPIDIPLILDVNTVNGSVAIRNHAATPVQFSYYEILSDVGALNPTGWLSLDDAEGGDPPGVGWDEGGGVSTHALVESNNLGSLTLPSGQLVSLNSAFNAALGVQDLTFNYVTANNVFRQGVIFYNDNMSVIAAPEPASVTLYLVAAAACAVVRRRDRVGLPRLPACGGSP